VVDRYQWGEGWEVVETSYGWTMCVLEREDGTCGGVFGGYVVCEFGGCGAGSVE
jgi:hypothetical protein